MTMTTTIAIAINNHAHHAKPPEELFGPPVMLLEGDDGEEGLDGVGKEGVDGLEGVPGVDELGVPEGVVDGLPEGEVDGLLEGVPEGVVDGLLNGTAVGMFAGGVPTGTGTGGRAAVTKEAISESSPVPFILTALTVK